MINDILLSSYHGTPKSPRNVDKTLTGLQINMELSGLSCTREVANLRNIVLF